MVDDLFDISGDDDPPDVILRLHVQPGAGRTAVMGRHGHELKVKVAAPPTGGRANDACLALVAETLGIPTARLELTSGASSRSKRIRARGVPTDEVRRALQLALEQGNAGGPSGVRPGAR